VDEIGGKKKIDGWGAEGGGNTPGKGAARRGGRGAEAARLEKI